MDDGPGLDHKAKYSRMRITVITHAGQACRLSEERVKSTWSVLENALRKQLGDEVQIETIVSKSEPPRPHIVDVSAYGSGNVEPLRRVHDRNQDPELDRRIDIIVEKISALSIRAPGTYPLRVSAVTRNWHVTLQRLRLLVGNATQGMADLIIRNVVSGKAMKGTVALSGPMDNRCNIDVTELSDGQPPEGSAVNYVSTEGVGFVTSSDMRFADFNNQLVRIEHVRSPIGIGSGLLCLSFDGLGDYARQLKVAEGSRLGLANIEPFAVLGQLRMIGHNPGDYWMTDMTSYSAGEVEKHWRDSLSLTFSAENAQLDPAGRDLLVASATSWGKRFSR